MSSPSGRLTDGGSSTNGYNGTAESSFAVKRLNRDLKELLIDQPTMTTISALPTQNMLGRLGGCFTFLIFFFLLFTFPSLKTFTFLIFTFTFEHIE